MVKDTPFIDMIAFALACVVLYVVLVQWFNIDVRLMLIFIFVNTNQIYTKLVKVGKAL